MMAVDKEGGQNCGKELCASNREWNEKQIVRMLLNCFELSSFALIDSI